MLPYFLHQFLPRLLHNQLYFVELWIVLAFYRRPSFESLNVRSSIIHHNFPLLFSHPTFKLYFTYQLIHFRILNNFLLSRWWLLLLNHRTVGFLFAQLHPRSLRRSSDLIVAVIIFPLITFSYSVYQVILSMEEFYIVSITCFYTTTDGLSFLFLYNWYWVWKSFLLFTCSYTITERSYFCTFIITMKSIFFSNTFWLPCNHT